MTPAERDRLAKAEQAISDMRDDIRAIRGDCQQLTKALHMGRGGFFAILRLGAFLAALAAVGAWLYEHFR